MRWNSSSMSVYSRWGSTATPSSPDAMNGSLLYGGYLMECLTCQSIAGEKRISPGPFIYVGTYWLVDHGYPTALKDWLVIVTRRHVEALHELSREEFAELAEIQYKLAQIVSQDE